MSVLFHIVVFHVEHYNPHMLFIRPSNHLKEFWILIYLPLSAL